MISREKIEKIFTASFYGGLIFKAAIGFFEISVSIILWFASIDILKKFTLILASHELLEDPGDLLANWIVDAANNLSISTKSFITLYLLVHGVVKLVLITLLIKKKKWSYPAAMMLLLTTIFIQLVRIVEHYSAVLTVLNIIDIIIFAVVWREYFKMSAKK